MEMEMNMKLELELEIDLSRVSFFLLLHRRRGEAFCPGCGEKVNTWTVRSLFSLCPVVVKKKKNNNNNNNKNKKNLVTHHHHTQIIITHTQVGDQPPTPEYLITLTPKAPKPLTHTLTYLTTKTHSLIPPSLLHRRRHSPRPRGPAGALCVACRTVGECDGRRLGAPRARDAAPRLVGGARAGTFVVASRPRRVGIAALTPRGEWGVADTRAGGQDRRTRSNVGSTRPTTTAGELGTRAVI